MSLESNGTCKFPYTELDKTLDDLTEGGDAPSLYPKQLKETETGQTENKIAMVCVCV